MVFLLVRSSLSFVVACVCRDMTYQTFSFGDGTSVHTHQKNYPPPQTKRTFKKKTPPRKTTPLTTHPSLHKKTVMLLGQAESGKSTLQKQFQLYYASNTLERERPAWRPVVYFNVIKAVRMILEELDFTLAQGWQPPPVSGVGTGSSGHSREHSRSRGQIQQHQHQLAPSPLTGSPRGSPPHHAYANSPITPSSPYTPSANIASGSGSGTSSTLTPHTAVTWPSDLSTLRTKLLPLVAVEDALASDLSGGVTVAGGRTGVFVRAGWQALVAPALNLNRAWGRVTNNNNANNTNNNSNNDLTSSIGLGELGNVGSVGGPPVNDLVARMLAATKEEVETLWRHPNVRTLVKYRKLRLEESAAL